MFGIIYGEIRSGGDGCLDALLEPRSFLDSRADFNVLVIT